MATIYRMPLPGRDTCAGTCETEAGCTCIGIGCTQDCDQGRRCTCQGKRQPIPRATRWFMRDPVAAAYTLGCIAVALVLLCVVLASALARHH